MKTSTRRGFLNAAATAISGVVAGGTAPPSLANAAPYDADAIAAEISAKLFAGDGLARPIPETSTVSDLAKGLDTRKPSAGGGIKKKNGHRSGRGGAQVFELSTTVPAKCWFSFYYLQGVGN